MFYLNSVVLHFQKNIRLNSTRYHIMKISNKKELQQNVNNQSLDIGFKDFMKIYNTVQKFFFFLGRGYNFKKIFYILGLVELLIKFDTNWEIKGLDSKIEANEAQENLNGETAKIFVLL